jgi:hypothetical protein
MVSPTQRSLKLMRDLGYHSQVVERWNPFAHIRQDLYGWIDLVCVNPTERGILGIQTTTMSHSGARTAKAMGNPALIAWLLAGGRLEVHGWRKLKGRWQVAREAVGMADLTGIDKGAL